MKKKVLELNYNKHNCSLLVSIKGKVSVLHGEVSISKELGFHDYGHAIRQLLTDKYGFDLPCVYKPLDEKTFADSEIFGLHI